MKKLLFITLMVGLYSTVASAGGKLGELHRNAQKLLMHHSAHKHVADKLDAQASKVLGAIAPEVAALASLAPGTHFMPSVLHGVTEKLHRHAS